MNTLCRSVTSCFLLRRLKCNNINSGVRCLFNDQYLNIDKFVDARELTQRQYGNMKENFLIRMKQQLDGAATMIFTEDLKTVIHLAKDLPEELEICERMIKKFHNQNKELRFGTFVFGPVIMRLLHHLRKPEMALEMVMDEVIGDFFSQVRSYVIAMDLLYEHNYYEEVIKLNKIVASKQLTDTKFPRDCVVLAAASCYKLNTPESLQIASDLVTEARQVGAPVNQKAIYFISALALNQDKADIAMELLSSLNANNNTLGNNLKLITLAKLGRFRDAFNILERKVEQDVPSQTFVRGDICQFSLDAVKEAIDNIGDTELSHEFENLCRSLEGSNSITVQTVDGFLSAPISPRPVIDDTRFAMRDSQRSGPGAMYKRRDRDEPFFRRENRVPFRQQAYGGGLSEE